MKKKILITSFDLQVGGVSKSLINLLNNMDYSKYDVTLILQLKKGEFLNQLNRNVNLQFYNLTTIKNSILKKIINGLKFLKIILKNYHQYDFSACYFAGYRPSAILAKMGSRNNAIWVHSNIVNFVNNYEKYNKKNLFCNNKYSNVKKYIRKCMIRKFKHILFVSENGKKAYLDVYKADMNKSIVCYNLIDYKDMIRKSKEKIDNVKVYKKPIFLNVSRHTEYDKKLTRLINACAKLKNEYDFTVIMIGEGEETENYKSMVENSNLQCNFIFLGLKSNPFPYYKISDAFVLTSEFEGYPTTYLESMVFNLPIITTDVSDAQTSIKDKFGIVVKNDDYSIYDGMKQFLDKGCKIKNKFDPEQYNKDSMRIVEDLINGKS